MDRRNAGGGRPGMTSPQSMQCVSSTYHSLQILALFELSTHPKHSHDRVTASIVLLDNIIRYVNLSAIDANDPEVAKFARGAVPVVHLDGYDDIQRKCSCIPPDAPQPPDAFTSWSYPLPWDSSWDAKTIRDEECRRLCWSALSLVSNYTSQCAALGHPPHDLFLSDPSNVCLFTFC